MPLEQSPAVEHFCSSLRKYEQGLDAKLVSLSEFTKNVLISAAHLSLADAETIGREVPRQTLKLLIDEVSRMDEKDFRNYAITVMLPQEPELEIVAEAKRRRAHLLQIARIWRAYQ